MHPEIDRQLSMQEAAAAKREAERAVAACCGETTDATRDITRAFRRYARAERALRPEPGDHVVAAAAVRAWASELERNAHDLETAARDQDKRAANAADQAMTLEERVARAPEGLAPFAELLISFGQAAVTVMHAGELADGHRFDARQLRRAAEGLRSAIGTLPTADSTLDDERSPRA